MTIASRSQEKCLILGCGDLGQRLAPRLAALGYAVTGVRRRAQDSSPPLRYLQADLGDREALADLLRPDYSVLVLSMTPSERSDSGYYRAYVQTCELLLGALKQQQLKPRLIIFISSTAVYGQDDGSWVDESSYTEPQGYNGQRLLEAEQLLLNSEFTCCILRFSGIYGPGRQRLIEQVRTGCASASHAYSNRIHAEDCAAIMAHLIELQHTQTLAPIYLASDCAPTPMVEVEAWIAAQLGVEQPCATATLNQHGNKRCANQRLLATGYSFIYADFKRGYSDLLKDYS